jgi:ribosome-associated translation inhibitor RaiA
MVLDGCTTSWSSLQAVGTETVKEKAMSLRETVTTDAGTVAPVRPAPFADRIARADKRLPGRAAAADVPAYIRAVGTNLDPADRDYVRQKLGRKLGKFASSIERVSVRVEDVNGPRGGVDKRCRIKVVLSGMPSIVVEEQHYELQATLDGALARTERAVRRAVEQRRTAR